MYQNGKATSSKMSNKIATLDTNPNPSFPKELYHISSFSGKISKTQLWNPRYFTFP